MKGFRVALIVMLAVEILALAYAVYVLSRASGSGAGPGIFVLGLATFIPTLLVFDSLHGLPPSQDTTRSTRDFLVAGFVTSYVGMAVALTPGPHVAELLLAPLLVPQTILHSIVLRRLKRQRTVPK
jgi:heme exporter protein D